jgi:hypothetical protein
MSEQKVNWKLTRALWVEREKAYSLREKEKNRGKNRAWEAFKALGPEKLYSQYIRSRGFVKA